MDYTDQKVNNGGALFLKFYPFISILRGNELEYEITGLPGIKEGLSGSILVGYNVGIDESISKEKEKSALEVLKYMSSREFQKSLVLEKIIISGILTLYDDKEVCSQINNCEYYKDLQVIAKPVNKTDNFEEYSEKFANYFYEYLYGNETEKGALKKMDDITKIYYISIETKETIVGLIFFILLLVTIALVILSLSFLYIKKFENYFLFLPKSLWFMVFIGILMILSVGFLNIGKISIFKCHLKSILFFGGYSFIYLPLIYKLLILFPTENKYSIWVFKNKYLFFIVFILLNVILNGLSLFQGFNVRDIILDKGENYQTCKIDNLLIKIIFIFTVFYKFIIMLMMLLLIFIEWNNKAFFYDMKFIVISIYINLMTIAILSIFDFFIIINYIWYFVIKESIILLISISNHFILYDVRLILSILLKKDELDVIIDNIKLSNSIFKSSECIESSYSNTNSEKTREIRLSYRSNSVISKILNLHYGS